MKSWKTTASGFIAGLMMIFGQFQSVFDNDPKTNPSVEVVGAALGLMGIGFFARDNKVTSEQAGAK